MAVALLAALVEPRLVPARARVTMTFDRIAERSFIVALRRFEPPDRMGWPVRLAGRAWRAFNTAGTVHHWVSSTVLASRSVFSSQRFALDLVRIDVDGLTHPPSTDRREDYYS